MLALNSLSQVTLIGLLIAVVSSQLVVSQTPGTYNLTAYKQRVYNDNENDDLLRLSTKELILKAGFSYKTYYVIARDNYITPLIRLINKKVTQLRPIPMIMFHGANIDSSSYCASSTKSHHPEPYPRSASDGPFTSSNRSLAFALANDGWDVWLVGVRASNKDAQRWTNDTRIQQQIKNGDYSSLTNESLYDFAKTSPYWQYGEDDVGDNEVGIQIDLVKNVTNATEVNIYSFSLSTATTLAFLVQNPDYARQVRVYFQMAPAIAASHFSSFDELYFEKLCPLFPTRGAGFFPSFTIQPLLRELLIATSISPEVKYSLIYALTTQVFGPSPPFQTNLERNIISRIFQPVSFKTVQQYCQNAAATPRKFRRFDYGVVRNPSYYNGSIIAPLYNISRLFVQRWAIISGSTDGLASPDTVRRLIAAVNTTNPVIQHEAYAYNHLDMIAGTTNDINVNLPVLRILNQYSS